MILLDKEDNNHLSNENVIRTIVLNKITSNEPLGFSIAVYKHRLFDIYAIFVDNIQPKGLADM